MNVNKLHQGDLCEITYKTQSGNNRWYLWDATAVFLDQDPHFGGMTSWSLRPHSGTMLVPTPHLVKIHLVASNAERQARRGDERAKLPKRRKGAIEGPH